MALELFKILGTIAVNNTEANKKIDETSEKSENFAGKLKNGIGTATKWGVAIVGATTTVCTGLIEVAKSSASTADNIDKMSQKIGISRQAYQELDFICSQSGTSVDTLQAGMKSLTSAMDGANSGTATNVEQFNKLGVSVTDVNGNLRSQGDVMWETLSALQRMENQTEKARLATELFGRSGTELMPLLNGVSGSIDEMKQQAHDLGLVLSDELIDNGVNLTDSLDQTKRAFSSIVTQLSGSLMPIVEKASDYIQKSFPSIQSFVERLSPVITNLLDNLLPPLMDLGEQIFPILFDSLEQIIPPLTNILQSILPVITELITLLLPPVIKIVQMILPMLISLLTPLMNLIEPIFELLEPIINLLLILIEPLLQLLNIVLTPLINTLSIIIDGILSVLSPLIKGVAEVIGEKLKPVIQALQPVVDMINKKFIDAWNDISGVWSSVGDFFSRIWENIKSAFSKVTDWFKNTFSDAWNSVKNVFSTGGKIFDGIKEGISNVFKTVVNGLIGSINKVISIPFNAINNMLSKIKNINILGISPFNWISTFNVPQIPKLAKGGVLKKGQTGYLEGDGAEAVVPLEKNTQWIDKVSETLKDNLNIQNDSTPTYQKQQPFTVTINLNIDKFVNNTNEDIEVLAEKLMTVMQEKINRKGFVFA